MRRQNILALGLIASLLAACGGNETKKEEPTPSATASAETPAAKPAAKPVCPPEPKAKTTKKSSKTAAKTTAKKEAAPVDCEPASNAKPVPAAASKPAALPPAEAPASSATGKACNPCMVKSRDGTYEGEVFGTIPPGSRWARLKIGMNQPEVESILGVSHNVRAYVTGKAFIPFYFGSDRHRYEVVYAGQGSVAYTGGSFGGGSGVLMMINYDPKIQ